MHKEPPFSLVGWFTAASAEGPREQHVVFHKQLMAHVEPGLLVAFHGDKIAGGDAGGAKLPVTVYEGVFDERVEQEAPPQQDDQGSKMEGVEQQPSNQEATGVWFREVTYTVETGEAEMIAVDFVAKGGGNAAAVSASSGKPQGLEKGLNVSKNGNAKEVNGAANGVAPESASLLPEEEECEFRSSKSSTSPPDCIFVPTS